MPLWNRKRRWKMKCPMEDDCVFVTGLSKDAPMDREDLEEGFLE